VPDPLTPNEPHPIPIVAASLAPDASRAVTVTKDGMLRTWVNGAVVHTGRTSVHIGGGPAAAALSGDVVKVLWVAGRMVRLYEHAPETRKQYRTVRAPAPVKALALSPSGSAAVVACDDGTLRGLDVPTREFGWTLATGELPVRAVATASDGGPVVAVFADGTVRRYDLGTGTSRVVGTGTPVSAVAVTPDGEVVVTAADGVLRRWDLRTGAPPEIHTL
jgi:WD40 repeat protein